MLPSPERCELEALLGAAMGCAAHLRPGKPPYHYVADGLLRVGRGGEAERIAAALPPPVSDAAGCNGYINLRVGAAWCREALVNFAQRQSPSPVLPARWRHACTAARNALARQRAPFRLAEGEIPRAVALLELGQRSLNLARARRAGTEILNWLVPLTAEALRGQLDGEAHLFLFVGQALLGSLISGTEDE